MFDDQMPKTSGQVPGNLPIGEPEDMFSEVEKAEPAGVPEADTPPSSPSALGAGALRPVEKEMTPTSGVAPELNKVEESLGIQSNAPVQPIPQTPPATPADMYTIKEPALTRGLVGVIIATVAVVILGSGGWWIYNSFIKTAPEGDIFVAPQANGLLFPEEEELPVLEEVEEPIVVVPEDLEVEEEEDLGQDILDEQILFGEPIDTDGDGLDDQRENEIGTDPNNWDTDGDDLTDYEEVTFYKTDPFNPDTDGDSYLDGAEVREGWNPAGPGKLFEPPAEEEVEVVEEGSIL